MLFPSATEADEASLTRHHDGSFDFHYTCFAPSPTQETSLSAEAPLTSSSGLQAAPEDANSSLTHQTPQTPIPRPLTASEEPSLSPLPTHSSTSVASSGCAVQSGTCQNGEQEEHQDEQQEVPRVTVIGRLGRSPTFRTTRAGKLVARFPLAEHTEEGETICHSVLAFGERAASLQKRAQQGELSKGLEVELVGYPHSREYQSRSGHTKQVTEIYLAALRRLQAPLRGADQGHHLEAAPPPDSAESL